MIEHLQKTGGFTSSGLTLNEKNELEQLRREINKYREMESKENEKGGHESDSGEEDPDEVMDDNEIKAMDTRKSMIGARTAVSAEVYGKFNNKTEYKAKIIPKSDEQIQRIKLKILQSFLFESLDPKDVDVVINAMEERVFLYIN